MENPRGPIFPARAALTMTTGQQQCVCARQRKRESAITVGGLSGRSYFRISPWGAIFGKHHRGVKESEQRERESVVTRPRESQGYYAHQFTGLPGIWLLLSHFLPPALPQKRKTKKKKK